MCNKIHLPQHRIELSGETPTNDFAKFRKRQNATSFPGYTKRSKMDTNHAQIASKTQRQPYVEVSEVYLHIRSFILACFGLKLIFHTNSLQVFVALYLARQQSHTEFGPPMICLSVIYYGLF